MSEIKLPSGLEITGKLGEVVSINHAPPDLRKGDKLFTADQMKAAILEERERCAKIAETVALETYMTPGHVAQTKTQRETIVSAIRSQ